MVFAFVIERAGQAIEKTFGSNLDHLETSPPIRLSDGGLDLSQYTGSPIWYIRLHGIAEEPGLRYGEDGPLWVPALSVEQVRDLDLSGTVVISGCCHAVESDFPQAYLDAGAIAFVGGSGFNFAAASDRVIGADTLARWMTKGLSKRLSPTAAYRLARMRLVTTAWRMADRDALQFDFISKGA